MSGKLQNKVAIITGSGAGIGKEIARKYAQAGAKVVIADCNEDALKTTVTEFNEAGYDAFGVKVNVDAVVHFGRIDILVNNAGVGDNMQATANVQDTVCQRVMDINVTGMMRAIRQALPVLIENGGGTIVNMALIAGLTGGRGGLAYTNAKHAVVGMTKKHRFTLRPTKYSLQCHCTGACRNRLCRCDDQRKSIRNGAISSWRKLNAKSRTSFRYRQYCTIPGI